MEFRSSRVDPFLRWIGELSLSFSDLLRENSFSLEIGWVDRKSDLRLLSVLLGYQIFLDVLRLSLIHI